MVDAMCRANPPYHLPSPDLFVNLLANCQAGVTPRWSVLGDVCLAPLGAAIAGILPVWMDRVASRYGRRLVAEGHAKVD